MLLIVGCSEKTENIRQVLKLCDDCYNAGDTTSVWPDAMKQAGELVRTCDDNSVIGEYYYQKSCFDLSRGTGDSIGYYLKQSREYYRKSDDVENYGKVLLVSAQFANMMQESDSVRRYALEGIEVAAKLPNLRGQLYGELLVAELSEGNMKKAVDYGKESLKLLKETHDTASYIIQCGNVGIAYRRQGLNDSAMVLYNDGLQLALPFGDEATTAYLYNNLSVLYGDKHRIDESISFAEKAIACAERSGETVEKLSGIANKASMLLLKEDYDAAVSEVRCQYPAVIESGSVPLRLKYLNMLISSYLHLEQLDSVAYFIKEGEVVSQGLPLENTGVLGIYEMKADYLVRTGHYKEALALLTRFDTPGGNQLMPRDKLLKEMALCHKSMGDYRTAFDLLNRSTEASDSIRSQKAERELSEFTVQRKRVRDSPFERRKTEERGFHAAHYGNHDFDYRSACRSCSGVALSQKTAPPENGNHVGEKIYRRSGKRTCPTGERTARRGMQRPVGHRNGNIIARQQQGADSRPHTECAYHAPQHFSRTDAAIVFECRPGGNAGGLFGTSCRAGNPSGGI